jgi:hypothetical protein
MVVAAAVGVSVSAVDAQAVPLRSTTSSDVSASRVASAAPIAADTALDEGGDVATVVGPIVALLALAQAIRVAAKDAKDTRNGALLAWSANTGAGLQQARLLSEGVRPATASVTALRELSEESRTLGANLLAQANALAQLPGTAPPSEDLPHHLGLVVTQLRLLSAEASATSFDCDAADNPTPYPDAILEQRNALAIASCSKGRQLVAARLATITSAATVALTQFQQWVNEMTSLDEVSRKRLARLAVTGTTEQESPDTQNQAREETGRA